MQILAGLLSLFAQHAFGSDRWNQVRQSVPAISYGKLLSVFLAANLLVLGLVMVQVLRPPNFSWNPGDNNQSRHKRPFTGPLRPMSLLNLFFLDKEIDPTTSKGVRLFFGREAPFLLSYYLGAISAFGVSLWLYFSSLREKITLLV